MKITLNSDLSIIYDFITVIFDKCNPEYVQTKYDEIGLPESDILEKSLTIVWKDLDENTPGLSLLSTLTKDSSCLLKELFYNNYTDLTDIKSFLALLFEIPVIELKKIVLKYYDINENSDSYYTDIVNSSEALFLFINTLKINSTQKLELLALMHDTASIVEPLHLLLKRIRNRIRRIFTEYHTFIKKFEKLLIIRIRNESEALLTEFSRIPIIKANIVDDDDFIIISSLFDEYAIKLNNACSNNFIVLGVHYKDLMEVLDRRFATVDSPKFLKAFSDKNRIKIIRLLTDREMYVGQIAQTCNLVMSTTSYHLDILLSAGILKSQIRSKRVYYTLNTNFIMDKLNKIQTTIKDKTF